MASLTVEKPRLRSASGQFSARGILNAKMLRKVWANARIPTPSLSFEAKIKGELLTFEATPCTLESVDKINAIIRGVSVITSGIVARGHDLEVDEQTMQEMKTCGETRGRCPVKVDHKSGAGAVCGYLSEFRIAGNKLKADWHLLQTHPQKDQILETAERMPEGVGLSTAFIGSDKPERTKSGKLAARCKELISVDYVALPAANPDGLFSVKVDTPQNTMNPEILAALKAALSEALAPIQAKIDAQAAQLESLSTQGDEGPTLEDLAQMDEKQLAELGITSEDVQAALAELATNGDPANGDPANGDPANGDPANGDPAEAVAPVGAPAMAAALAALTKQVTELSARINGDKAAKEQEKVETLFSEIEGKVVKLTEENARLTEAVKTGGKPATPSVDRNNVQFFSRNKDKGEFEQLVQLGIEDKKLSKAKSFEFARKENPAAYQDYLVRLGVKAPVTA